MCEHCQRAQQIIALLPPDMTVEEYRNTLLSLLSATIPEGEEVPFLLSILSDLLKFREGAGHEILH